MQINGLPLDYTPVLVGFDPSPLLEGACDAFVCFVTHQPIALTLKRIPWRLRTRSIVSKARSETIRRNQALSVSGSCRRRCDRPSGRHHRLTSHSSIRITFEGKAMGSVGDYSGQLGSSELKETVFLAAHRRRVNNPSRHDLEITRHAGDDLLQRGVIEVDDSVCAQPLDMADLALPFALAL
ncbi:hypothetical protein DMY87_14285 [Rhizobium wuzhouense]|uniref:Uncharacterized protein n=1 Tax=Rhizobium wuzhouense TaxID=1986026 RepID=A0ABX5NTL2_9HYPH|nr:hypothetical protein DMY87_14285 [Rhizobium wuzhouense]